MTTINKVTTVFAEAGATLDDATIQGHIDDQNADGYKLIAVDNLIGWYRLFWEKEIE